MEKIPNRQRGRRSKINPLRLDIARLWERGLSDEEIVSNLRLLLENTVIKEHPEWTTSQKSCYVEDRLPGKDSIGDFRRDELEPNSEKINKEPEPRWNIGLAIDHQLSAEAIANIEAVVRWRNQKNKTNEWMSLRQALWISRLYKIPALQKNIEKLWMTSIGYAVHEGLCELANITPLDTSELDSYLRKDDFIVIYADKLLPDGVKNGLIGIRRVKNESIK